MEIKDLDLECCFVNISSYLPLYHYFLFFPLFQCDRTNNKNRFPFATLTTLPGKSDKTRKYYVIIRSNTLTRIHT
jgi:hypothetical protein